MKAIYEFDAPESCHLCPIGNGTIVQVGTVCNALGLLEYVPDEDVRRHTKCPLRIVTDNAEVALAAGKRK